MGIFMSSYKLLDEDKAWIEARLEHLNQKIKDLGEEFNEVLNQSSETWHDNAPFDAVVDKQSLLYAEYSHLKHIILNSQRIEVSKKSKTVAIGSQVTVLSNGKNNTYFIAGDWSYLTGKTNDSDAIVISCRTPIAKELLGKKVDSETKYGIVVELGDKV